MHSTIYITTPCLNSIETIDRTILSVVTQAGEFFIRYHVQDGVSTDGTVERLAWWQRRLASKGFPIQCLGVNFTYASTPDQGMYDALCQGFQAMRCGSDSFMSWINADDIFAQGAFAFITNVEQQFAAPEVSWVGGAVSILRGNMPLVNFDSPICREALKAGICDGVHWNFLQQEGTFFRGWLWKAVTPEKTIRPMKLAGDWNLWRMFAQRSSLVQTKFTLASFRIGEGQLSERLRDKYMGEIDSIVSLEKRRTALKDLVNCENLTRRLFEVAYKNAQLSIVDEGRSRQLLSVYHKVFGEFPKMKGNSGESKIVCVGKLNETVTDVSVEDNIWIKDNIIAFDRDWQFPAVTEQHAFHRLRDTGSVPDGIIYVAYPWAHLIDKIQTKAHDTQTYMAWFRVFCSRLPKNAVKVTVCQHIKMHKYMHLFEKAGISHIFWTHTTKDDVRTQPHPGVTLYPFPLYPVQVTEEQDIDATAERPHLFSFIGAKSNQYYLTHAREWILDLLRDHPRGLIIGRDTWHYNKVVYDLQIRPDLSKTQDSAKLVDQSASEQFKESMSKTVFALCPSGSGPNSIRLWESLGSGAIPVILADTYATPGNQALWDKAVVFCDETPEAIAALPARLEAIAADPDKIRSMRHAMRQLWLLYGPQSFVYDVQRLMLELSEGGQASGSVAPAIPFRETFLKSIEHKSVLTQQEALTLLRTCSGDLLLEGAPLLKEFDDQTPIGQYLILAQEALSGDHPAVEHFKDVCAHVAKRPNGTRVALAALNSGEGPKIFFLGRHSNRTPLSYASFRRHAENRLQWAKTIEAADIIMTGFNLDIRENAAVFENVVKSQPETKVVVLSEEPLWDSTWSGGFVERTRTAKCGETELTYTFLNHTNSNIFDFDRIPYFLLTNDDYLARYGLLLSRCMDMSPQQLLEHWEKAPIDIAFYAEVREGENYAKRFEEQAVYGLSTYRTEVARKTKLTASIKEGKGWKTDARRQDLPDWHLDKLAALDKRVRISSSFENTHQHSYISEKIFDAFAVGGIPTYYADDKHRIFKLVPGASMINAFGLSPDDAAEKISSFRPDMAFAEAWLNTARSLQTLFTNSAAIRQERERVVSEICAELEAI